MGDSSIQVKYCLSEKGRSVITIGPDETVINAIEKLVENNVGALPVCNPKGTLLGIISERDILKACARRSGKIGNTKVKEVMTKDVIICNPEDDLFYIINILTQKGIRHLPILDGSKLVGIISMRDIVDAQLEESKATVRLLREYISGGTIV